MARGSRYPATTSPPTHRRPAITCSHCTRSRGTRLGVMGCPSCRLLLLLDLGQGALQDLHHALLLLGTGMDPAAHRLFQLLADPMELAPQGVALVLGVTALARHVLEGLTHIVHATAHPVELRQDGVGRGAVAVEMSAARVGDVVTLLRALGLHRGVLDLLEIGERGIHHAGAGAVETAGAFLHVLDDLVAVARLVCEQRQDHELQVTGGELAPAAEAAAAHPLSPMAPEEAAEAGVPAGTAIGGLSVEIAVHGVSSSIVR